MKEKYPPKCKMSSACAEMCKNMQIFTLNKTKSKCYYPILVLKKLQVTVVFYHKYEDGMLNHIISACASSEMSSYQQKNATCGTWTCSKYAIIAAIACSNVTSISTWSAQCENCQIFSPKYLLHNQKSSTFQCDRQLSEKHSVVYCRNKE